MDFSSSGWSSRLHLIYPAVLWCRGEHQGLGHTTCALPLSSLTPPDHSSLTGLRPKGTQKRTMFTQL